MIYILKTVSEVPVTFAKAKDILQGKEKERKNEERELGHEQHITLEYLRSIPMLDKKVAEDIAKELIEAIPTLKEHQVIMIIDTLPDCDEDVELLFAKERMKLDKEQIKKVAEIIKKVKPEMVVKKAKKKAVPKKDDKVEEVKADESKKDAE